MAAIYLWHDEAIDICKSILKSKGVEYNSVRYAVEETNKAGTKYRIMYTDKEGNYKIFRGNGIFSLT